MKNPIKGLNKIFDSRIRLGIMSALMVNEIMDFNSLKNLLEVTDGNLASHMKSLEKEQYVTVQKQFIGRKPNTNFKATAAGKKAFEKHLDSLEELMNN